MSYNPEDILAEVRQRAQHGQEGWEHNFDRMDEDVAFLDGDQWPEGIVSEREDEGRPVLTINKMPAYVDQVVGDQRQMRPSIDVYPAQGDAPGRAQNLAGTKDYSLAEVNQGLIRSIEYHSGADIAYDTAMEHATAHGLGYIRLITEYSDDDAFDQDIFIRRVRNWRSVILDPAFEAADGSDARWGLIFYPVHKDEFDRRWPKKERVDIEQHSGEEYHAWADGDYVRIAEYYRRVPDEKTLYLLSDQRVVEDIESIQDELSAQGITVLRERKVECDKVEWMKVSGVDILEGPTETVFHAIPIIPVLGKELVVDGKVYYRGVIRNAKDSQRMYNYWRSAATEAVALQPKAPFVISDKQLEGYQDWWDKANTKNLPYLPYKFIQGEALPQRQAPPQPANGMIQEVVMADEDIRATTGMHESDMGMPSNEKSGRAILARQQKGQTKNFAFSDNLTRSIRHIGQMLVKAIPKIYDTERIVRIRFPDDTEDFVPINQTIIDEQTGEPVTINDLSAGKFDVMVKAGPSYSTQRQEAADAIVQFVQAIGTGDPVTSKAFIMHAVKNMDWPNTDELVSILRKSLPPGLVEIPDDEEPPPPPESTPEQQADMADSMAKMAKAEADMAGAQADKAAADAKLLEAMEKIENLDENIKESVANAVAQTLQQLAQTPQSGEMP